jgi:hypothetical protein
MMTIKYDKFVTFDSFPLVITINTSCSIQVKGKGSAVGITTGYELDDRMVGFKVPVKSRIFASSYRPDQL